MRYDFENPLWKKRPAEAKKACEQEIMNRLKDLDVQQKQGMDVFVEVLVWEEMLGLKHKVEAKK